MIEIGRLRGEVVDAVRAQAVTDLHTHLFPPERGELELHGMESLLTYHYLISEFLVARPEIEPAGFLSLGRAEQARRIWNGLFVEQAPLSEAACGVVSTLGRLGIECQGADYESLTRRYRALEASLTASGLSNKVFALAGVRRVVMTNNPFDPREWKLFEGADWDRERYLAALRLDDALFRKPMLDSGLFEGSAFEKSMDQAVAQSRPRYCALSLSCAQLEGLLTDPFFVGKVMPSLARHGLPLAIMLGVRRAVNPAFGLAGDGMETVSLEPLQLLLQRFPAQKFLVTTLDRGSQHGLAVMARLFQNLRIFGCWWYMNQPDMVADVTAMRMDILGRNFVPQHSDARVLEQLIYKWEHFRSTLSEVLIKRYERLSASGWKITREQIRRDARDLLEGNADRELGI